LFISAVATAENTAICVDNRTFVYSIPKQSWGDYYRQKTRHLSTSPRYQWLTIALLMGLSASLMGFYGVAILGLFCIKNSLLYVLTFFGIRWLLMAVIQGFIKYKLQEKHLPMVWLWGDIGLVGFLVVFSLSFIARKKYIW
jgi:hypothetical protein